MKNTRIDFFNYLVLLLVMFSACTSEKIEFVAGEGAGFPTENIVSASFYGRVVNQDLEPVIDAVVRIGTEQVRTDSFGVWLISNAKVQGNQAYVVVEAEGYFHASRTRSVFDNSRNKIDITAVELGEPTQVSGQTGGELIADNVSILFRENSFSELDGRPYVGEALVYTHALNPENAEVSNQMPGRLEAFLDGQGLVSMGMIAVELRSPSGDELKLRDGVTAQLTFDKLSKDVSMVDSIPMWHFDEQIGTWIKEGVSIASVNQYVAEVSHFSWWNCDIGIDVVKLCFVPVCKVGGADLRASSVENKVVLVHTIAETNGFSRGGYAELTIGEPYCDFVPFDGKLTLVFLDTTGTEFHRIVYESQGVDANLGEIALDCDKLSDYVNYETLISNIGNGGGGTGGGQITPPTPRSMQFNWNQITCNADLPEAPLDLFISTSAVNTSPLYINLNNTPVGTSTITVFSNQSANVRIENRETGDRIVNRSYAASSSQTIGTIIRETGYLFGDSADLNGRIENCDGIGINDVTIKVSSAQGLLLAELKTGFNGRYEFTLDGCDPKNVEIAATKGDIELISGYTANGNASLPTMTMCAADGNYFWNAKLNGRSYSFPNCNGRAGASGWVAYSDDNPSSSSPGFILEHDDVLRGKGKYSVSSTGSMRFQLFRVGAIEMTALSHPFEGELEVTEWGDVAAGKFIGTYTADDGSVEELEMDLRFLRP